MTARHWLYILAAMALCCLECPAHAREAHSKTPTLASDWLPLAWTSSAHHDGLVFLAGTGTGTATSTSLSISSEHMMCFPCDCGQQQEEREQREVRAKKAAADLATIYRLNSANLCMIIAAFVILLTMLKWGRK